MKNIKDWRQSKYVFHDGKILPTKDARELGAGSRLIARLVAGKYQEAIPKYCHGRLLDLGCGKAPFYGAYKDFVTNVELVDWENGIHKNPCIDLFADLSGPLSLTSDSYDTVILSDVLEHIPAPEQLLDEIYRILSKGGYLLLNVPFIYGIHEAPHDYYRYTGYALERLAVLSGFRVEALEPLGGSIEVLADILCKNIHFLHIPGLGRIFVILIQNLAGWIPSTALFKGPAKKTAKIFPLGYFMVLRK